MGYFNEMPQDKPILPPQQPVKEATGWTNDVNDLVPPTDIPQPITPPLSGEFKGLPVRAAGDRIFLIKGGKKFWISNPEAYTKLGFKFGDEVRIDQATLDVLEEGEPLR